MGAQPGRYCYCVLIPITLFLHLTSAHNLEYWCRRLESFEEERAPPSDCSTKSPHLLVATEDEYGPNTPLTLILAGNTDYSQAVIQAHHPHHHPRPLGSWMYTGASDDVRCKHHSRDTVYLTQTNHHATLHWLPDGDYSQVHFVAFVVSSDNTTWRVISDPVYRRNPPPPFGSVDFGPDIVFSPHQSQAVMHNQGRQKRAADDFHGGTTMSTMSEAGVTGVTDVTQPMTEVYISTDSDKDASTPDFNLTEDYVSTTEPPKKSLVTETYFLLLIIIGSYVGMYMIFALLII